MAVITPEILQIAKSTVSNLSLEQKLGQMTMAERTTCSPEQVREYHIGAILSGAGSAPEGNSQQDWLKMTDAYWQMYAGKDSPHIPILYASDAIHGHNNVKCATIFPHNIGIGASHEPALAAKVAKITAREMRSTGVNWALAPTLAVAQDLRWGRTYESYSQSTEHVASYAGECVRALQQDIGTDGVLACVKHWIGDGGTEYGIDQGNTVCSEKELRERHLPPYLRAIEAGALSVMSSYSSWNGTKCHGNRYLIRDILKNELQFQGIVVSDWEAIEWLRHDYYSAVALAVNAGIDMFMVPESWQRFIQCIREHVELGTVSISRINDAVTRIIAVKLATGLFDAPRPSATKWAKEPTLGRAEHRLVAREAVRKSLVLLKNEDTLPLKNDSRILVVGEMANSVGHQCGGFTVSWQGEPGNDSVEGGSSIWQAISKTAPNAELFSGDDCSHISPSQYDVAVVVVGENPYAEGPGDIRNGDDLLVKSGSQIGGQFKLMEPYGSSLKLARLHPNQIKLIEQLSDKNIPVVTLLLSGRPLVCNDELELSSAFVAAWLPGSEALGISDVLFGDFDFTGKLSFDWPANTRQTQSVFKQGYGLRYAQQQERKPFYPMMRAKQWLTAGFSSK